MSIKSQANWLTNLLKIQKQFVINLSLERNLSLRASQMYAESVTGYDFAGKKGSWFGRLKDSPRVSLIKP